MHPRALVVMSLAFLLGGCAAGRFQGQDILLVPPSDDRYASDVAECPNPASCCCDGRDYCATVFPQPFECSPAYEWAMRGRRKR